MQYTAASFGRCFTKNLRAFSTTLSLRAPPQGIPTKAAVTLPRSLIAVSGPDSATFLNGLITTRPPESYDGLSVPSQYSALLNAKGRVISDLFVYAAHDNKRIQSHSGSTSSCYVLEVDSALAEKVCDVLDFHILLSDVEVKPLDDLKVHALWNDEAEIDANKLNSFALWTEDKRAPGLGFRVISDSQSSSIEEITGYPSATLDEYRLRRYLFGVPEGSTELKSSKALPLDSCIDYMGGINFEKGCYMGQELTIRTHHHGNVRKRIMPVIFMDSLDEALPEDLYLPKELGIEPGSEIQDETPIGEADKAASVFGSSSNSPFGTSSPFGSRQSPRQRPAGKVIASLGNVGLAYIRVDTLGHTFRLGELYVKPLTPFWWPNSEYTE